MDNASFLPEDYIEQRAERRTNFISLILFGIVMIAVFAAFLVTNREWSHVRASQNSINQQYQLAASKIDDLNELEEQKDQMLNKAELAAALVERVPRSNLLAEFINRMPPRLSLIEFNLKSEKTRAAIPKRSRRSAKRNSGPKRAKTRQEASREGQQKKVEAPKHTVKITMSGVAPTDLEVSRYMAALSAFSLLKGVTLEYSEEREFDNRIMRKFEITMRLDPKADIRNVVKPATKSRDIRNPMSDELEFGNSKQNNTVSVPTSPSGGE